MTGYSKAQQLARGPKRQRRIVDTKAVRAALMSFPRCAACGGRADGAHHVVQKGSPHFGDDVRENIVGLCGSGTTLCHGAFHGSPYTLLDHQRAVVERRDQEWAGRAIGVTLIEKRPDVIEYALERAGAVYLEKTYYIWQSDSGDWVEVQ